MPILLWILAWYQVCPHLSTVVMTSEIQTGDAMILYRCGGYLGHDRRVSGVEAVTELEGSSHDPRLTDTHFQCFPLSRDTTGCSQGVPRDLFRAVSPADRLTGLSVRKTVGPGHTLIRPPTS